MVRIETTLKRDINKGQKKLGEVERTFLKKRLGLGKKVERDRLLNA